MMRSYGLGCGQQGSPCRRRPLRPTRPRLQVGLHSSLRCLRPLRRQVERAAPPPHHLSRSFPSTRARAVGTKSRQAPLPRRHRLAQVATRRRLPALTGRPSCRAHGGAAAATARRALSSGATRRTTSTNSSASTSGLRGRCATLRPSAPPPSRRIAPAQAAGASLFATSATGTARCLDTMAACGNTPCAAPATVG